jgi:hypothetical protein
MTETLNTRGKYLSITILTLSSHTCPDLSKGFSHRGYATVEFPLPSLGITAEASCSQETSKFIFARHLPYLYTFRQDTERQKILHRMEVSTLRI